MIEILIVGGMVAGLWLLLLLLRVPSSIAFLSLLIGQLLSAQANEDVYELVSSVVSIPDPQYVQATLLMLPLALTILLLRNRVPKSKLFVEAIPTLLLSALCLVLLAPLITQLSTLLDIATHDQVDAYRSLVVVAASVAALLSAWLSYPKPNHGHGKHHK